MILPPMGAISEVIAAFSRKNIFGYSFVAFSSLAIAIFGFLVWAHHLFVSGISVYSALVCSFLTYAVAIPSAVKTVNWTATLYKGAIWLKAPMIWAICFLGLFLVGGLTGLFTAALGVDVHIHDTYFVVAHFHYIMVGGAILGYLAGLHFWWPKITGRMYSEFWSRISAILVFVGFNFTFFPQFILGYLGMPRRYHMYPDEFQVLNVMSSAGAAVLGLGYLLPIIYFLWSLKHGEVAGPNPWGASGLEWLATSPPTPWNFHHIPVVESRTPLWGEETTELKVATGLRSDRREFLCTSALDALPDTRHQIPSESYWPLVMAFAMAITFIGAVYTPWAYVAGFGVTMIAFAGWAWPRGENPDRIVTVDHRPPFEAA
jgi:cytochrome c oxidase subunit 1